MFSDRILVAIPVALVAFAGIAQVLNVLATGASGWDDGAITASYALTLANGGDFALTQISPRAEGSSSLLFVAILALIYLPLSPDLHAAVVVTQILALTSVAGSSVVLYRTARLNGWSFFAAMALIAVFCLLPMHMREIQNGMEMTLFGFLMVAFVHAFYANRRVAFALVPFILLVRFEAVFYLGAAFVMVGLLNFEKRKISSYLGLFTLAVFALISGFRIFYFGEFFPNTVSAKMLAPYSTPLRGLDGIQSRLIGPWTFIDTMIGFVMVAGVILIESGAKAIVRRIEFWILVAFFVFTFIANPNSGYGGRMFTGALPVFVYLLVSTTSECRPFQKLGPPLVLLALLAVTWQSLGDAQKAIKVALHGAWESGWVSKTLVNKVGYSILSEQVANPLEVAKRAQAAEELMKVAGRQRLTVVVPDVGGVGLCCNATLRVIDNALLTDPLLATKGWGALGPYLEEERPEIIFTHAMWSEASGIYELPFFLSEFEPVFFREMVFWISQDFMSELPTDLFGDVALSSIRNEDAINDIRENDWNYLRTTYDSILIADHSATIQNDD